MAARIETHATRAASIHDMCLDPLRGPPHNLLHGFLHAATGMSHGDQSDASSIAPLHYRHADDSSSCAVHPSI